MGVSVIKYRFSRGGSWGSVIDVQQLDQSSRSALGPYRCFGCGGELVPRLGEKKVKHFGHKMAAHCSRETYLHNLAKHAFFETYKKKLDSNSPYIFRVKLPAVCRHYEDSIGMHCETFTFESVDMTKHFPVVEMEKHCRGHVADILLESVDGKDVIFFEIAVTHECEQSKIDSGVRIIELRVKDEDDIKPIMEGCIHEGAMNVRTFNFNRRVKDGDICKGKCQKKVLEFLVYDSQKSIMLELTPEQAAKRGHRGRVRHREVIPYDSNEHDPGRVYRDKVRDAYFARVPIQNCFLCKYHGLDGVDSAIFCKVKRKSVGSNEAVDWVFDDIGVEYPMNAT